MTTVAVHLLRFAATLIDRIKRGRRKGERDVEHGADTLTDREVWAQEKAALQRTVAMLTEKNVELATQCAESKDECKKVQLEIDKMNKLTHKVQRINGLMTNVERGRHALVKRANSITPELSFWRRSQSSCAL